MPNAKTPHDPMPPMPLQQRLETALRLGKGIRVAGVDDAPFSKQHDIVNFSIMICQTTRFEGMLWGELDRDGHNATDAILHSLTTSKFLPQLHAVLLDGIALGGFNVVDLPTLSNRLQLPCITVMRKPPDMSAITSALNHFTDGADRLALMQQAGTIHHQAPFYFQAVGCSPTIAAQTLAACTDTGHVPEALRIAHLIGSAIKTGQSSKRA